MDFECFKAYDIRGVVGESITEEVCYQIGRATATVLVAKSMVIGHDARESSPQLAMAFKEGLVDQGCDVVDIKLAGTEEVYFATSFFGVDAGAVITASHNPIDYNGIKFVGSGSRPLDVEKEFLAIKKIAKKSDSLEKAKVRGSYEAKSLHSKEAFAAKVLSFVDAENLRPMRVVLNCGNGAAGPAVKEIKSQLSNAGSKVSIIEMFQEPDASFPNGIPNPILEENHKVTSDRVLAESADFGVAFDGDFDRCFFFDNQGSFVPGEIIIGLLATYFAGQGEDLKIVHEPRLVLNTRSVCQNHGITGVQTQTGHLFMKKAMRESEAIYGGEISAHHYFRDFYYCDSGMIPWILVCDLLSSGSENLADLVSSQRKQFPSSGEINFRVGDAAKVISSIETEYMRTATEIDRMDGLSISFPGWRFNLRASNTEPLLRLNLETIGNPELLKLKTDELASRIKDIDQPS